LDTLYKGQFKIRRKIATGGFATIYEATHVASGTAVAIKVGHLFDDPGYGKAIREEARLLSGFAHPNVVRVHLLQRPGKAPIYCARALDIEGRPYFFVMEYLAGETLAHYLQQIENLTVMEAAAIAVKVARGLRYVHKRGYAHNDLKLENVVFRTPVRKGEPFVPVLVDFGIATRLRVMLQTEAGSLYIMAPEQLGQASLAQAPELAHAFDPTKVDVWGIGVLLYRMLGGRLPFAERNQERLVDLIRTSRPTPLATLAEEMPPEIDSLVIDGCLAKDPRYRIDLVALGRHLNQIAGNSVAETVPPGRTGMLGRFLGRS
jgi:serine/threonine-protein kinase